MTPKQATKVLIDALTATAGTPPQRVSGCGRVYIVPTKESRADLRKACKGANRRWIKKAYGVGVDCMYLGYDNATGKELGVGLALAKALTAAGIECYHDAVGD